MNVRYVFPRTIWQIMSDELYEGLIMTHDIKTIESILLKKYDVKFFYDKNIFTISHIFDKFLYKKEVKEMLQLTNNLGWFPAQIVYELNNKQKFKRFSEENFLDIIESGVYEMNISFEAKYDIDLAEIPEELYHVTKLKYLEKIKKHGLIPQRHEKLTSHPERIYVTSSIDEAWVFIRGLMFRTPVKEREAMVIIKIDTTLMKDTLRLLRDPNFQREGVYTGYYTLNPIDPRALTILDVVNPKELYYL